MQAILTMNSRGVVTLPAKLRQAMGLKADDPLIAEMLADDVKPRAFAEVKTPKNQNRAENLAKQKKKS